MCPWMLLLWLLLLLLLFFFFFFFSLDLLFVHVITLWSFSFCTIFLFVLNNTKPQSNVSHMNHSSVFHVLHLFYDQVVASVDRTATWRLDCYSSESVFWQRMNASDGTHTTKIHYICIHIYTTFGIPMS